MRILRDLKPCGINTYGSADSTGLRWLDFGRKNPTGAWAKVRREAMTAISRIAHKLLVVNTISKVILAMEFSRAFESRGLISGTAIFPDSEDNPRVLW